ncbi:hypothetical protein ACLB2K_067462 [Fragaria x ananassa]
MSWYHEFLNLNYPEQKQSKTPKKCKQKPPVQGQLKLNVDGAFMPNETEGGVGGILRNDQGLSVAAFTKHISGISLAKQVELEAIRTGPQWLQKYGFPNCIIETDCQVAVAELQIQEYLSLEHSNIIDDIHQLLANLNTVSISFAPRTANAVAHRLASEAFESVGFVHWMDVIPVMLRDALQLDCEHITQ